MKTKFLLGSFLIAGAALLSSCNSVEGFPELPKPNEEAINQPLLRGSFCVYSETKQCFEGNFTALERDGKRISPCPGEGYLSTGCPYLSSSSATQSGGSSSSRVTQSGSSSSQITQSSSSSVRSSSSVPNCYGFVPGTLRQGKPQFCDERDNTKYVYVDINTQIWMAENLNYNTGNSNSKCYRNESNYCAIYGRLYTWNAAMNNACPDGWHLPSKAEWQTLWGFVFGDGKKGDALDLKAESSYWSLWADMNKDTYGFSALPGGYSSLSAGISEDDGKSAYWWTDTECTLGACSGEVYFIQIWTNSTSFGDKEPNDKNKMYSVRCLKNN